MSLWLQRLEREHTVLFFLLRFALDVLLIFLALAMIYFGVIRGWLR